MTSREDYRYEESGLPEVILIDTEIARCQACGEEMAAIPRVEELHRVLAFALASHPARLTGTEIRFLRTYLGWSGKHFARVMGVDPATVSRWEHDKAPMGIQADRLLRMMVFREKPIEEYATEEIQSVSRDDVPPLKLGLRNEQGAWHPVQRAA